MPTELEALTSQLMLIINLQANIIDMMIDKGMAVLSLYPNASVASIIYPLTSRKGYKQESFASFFLSLKKYAPILLNRNSIIESIWDLIVGLAVRTRLILLAVNV